MPEEERFPAPEFLRAGPPQDVKELDRVEREKWARVMLVVPERRESGGRTAFELALRGPYTIPLAVRREGVDPGRKDAWAFFSHPASVFPPEAAFWNVSGKGCLGARLAERTEKGVRLWDEVGAGLPAAEPVSDGLAGALGVLRRRAFAGPLPTTWSLDLLDLELDLLDLLRLSTLILRSQSPRVVAKDLLGLLARPAIRAFAEGCHDPEDLATMRALVEGQGDAEELGARLRIRPTDFTRTADVRDVHGKQALLVLLEEYEAFQREHGGRLRELGQGIAGAEARLEAIKAEVRRLQADAASKGRVTRFFSRTDDTLRQLKAEAIQCLRTMRELEAAYRQVPGYERLQGLTDRIQSFQASLDRVQALATDLFDHCVTQAQTGALRQLRSQVADPEGSKSGLKPYDLRLRADVLPRLMGLYSCAAYVLRRPDALPPGKPSRRKIAGIARLTLNLIELFRGVRYGTKTLGDVFDETWGQVLKIESRL